MTGVGTFETLKGRLNYLERWRELAIRPETVDKEDIDLWETKQDDLVELSKRCSLVRKQMNENVPIVNGPYDSFLEARPSSIPKAGMGLFYTGDKSLPANEIVCYYYGALHSFRSAREIVDRSYLMLVSGDVLVDPGPFPAIKARFINDPLNEDHCNCVFRPEHDRSAVLTTQVIMPGQEFFVSYGQAYWSAHPTPGRVKA